MNKEMTIIEIINKIANNEDIPKRIKYKDKIYIYNEPNQDYLEYNKDDFDFLGYAFCNWRTRDFINDKVEILEEDKDIELLDVALLSQSDNWLWCPSKDDFEKDIELNEYIISNIRENTLNFQRKLNEVIKEVNKLRKENNNG